MAISRAFPLSDAELSAVRETVKFRLAGGTDDLSDADIRALKRAEKKLDTATMHRSFKRISREYATRTAK